uniref:NADH-ubiquinone oxidoreductase chain 2 n=1 Tax=Torleya mikhaili TaxID=2816379 RepID=A0A899IKL1_9INSE|nr:NADH dehydrogenase subunit 2 [Torleya mikhaili]QSL98485.1 NADH dehydrogenase subunit 2 [Torleya mikhaili]
MFSYPARLLFLVSLVMGTLISISSNSWFGAWVGLEVNLLSFIPLLSNKNMLATEAALKYFLTQAMASIFLFTSIILYLAYFKLFIFEIPSFPVSLLFCTALLVKLGAAPLHFWFPGVMEGSSWMNNIILMTWQKLAPVILISYVFSMSLFSYIIICLSIMVGAVGGLNQTSLRKIMAYSSINHLGWILSGLVTSNPAWLVYFSFYSFLSVSIVSLFNHLQLTQFGQLFLIDDTNGVNKIMLFSNFLSLGGLPPFVGFFPKWLIIQGLAMEGLVLLAIFSTCVTLLVLFYYMRIFFPAILVSTYISKWHFKSPRWSSLNTIFGVVSLLSLPLFPLFYLFL